MSYNALYLLFFLENEIGIDDKKRELKKRRTITLEQKMKKDKGEMVL